MGCALARLRWFITFLLLLLPGLTSFAQTVTLPCLPIKEMSAKPLAQLISNEISQQLTNQGWSEIVVKVGNIRYGKAGDANASTTTIDANKILESVKVSENTSSQRAVELEGGLAKASTRSFDCYLPISRTLIKVSANKKGSDGKILTLKNQQVDVSGLYLPGKRILKQSRGVK